MKKNSLFLSIGMACILSCAAISFSPKDFSQVKADGVTDLGELNLSLNNNLSNWDKGIYVLSEETNSLPVSDPETNPWETRLYSLETNALVLNGIDITNNSRRMLVKHGAQDYYIGLQDGGYPSRTINDTVTIKGNWITKYEGVDYTVNIKPFTCRWNGSKWVQDFVIPELETYDKVSLTQAGIDDFSNERVDTEFRTVPDPWNTFAISAENTTNSFSFEFAFEAYGNMSEKALNVRIGNTTWDAGHFYHLFMCNSWNTTSGGVIVFNEKNGVDTYINQSGDLPCNLQPGARHVIEVGVIRVKNQNNNYMFVKYDGSYLYQVIKPVYTETFYPRIGLCYERNNIFVGTTMPEQKAQADTLVFDRGNHSSGVFFTGPENSIPVRSDWETRGAPVSKYNVLKNGEPLYTNRGWGSSPLVKHGTADYYLNFGDDYSFTFSEGDIVTLEDEFHFYEDNKSYSMSFHPVAVEFTNGDFVGVANIYSRLLEKLAARYDLDDYDDDKVPVVQGLLSQASTAFNNASSMRALWEAYYSYMEQLDEVPLNEEKMAEKLRRAKEAAIAELNAYINEDLYDEEHLEIVTNYVNTAIAQINAATTVQQVNQILANAKTQIEAVETKQVSIEQKIMSLEDGYEQYLAKYDVATLSDLSAIGDVHIYPKDSALESESFGTDGNPNAFNSRIATSDDNREGNMIFKFKYSSTNPLSSRYGAQLFIRLRGTASNSYVFHIAAEIEGAAGVRLGVLERDAIVEGTKVDYRANFAANTEYVIECGAIDLKEFDRTFIFIKIDGTFVAKLIVDNIKEESKPAVMIMDSYTNPETSDTVTLSSVEEGTTKADNATLLGRMILDNASNGDSLITTLRENTIPVNTRLYPATNDAITINGNPIAQNRSAARILKSTATKYNILLSYPLNDGDVVHVGGVFTYQDEDTSNKFVYRFFDTSFTYHASTNSWEQEAPSLDVAKIEAKETLANYVNLADYSDANQATITNIIETYTSRIDGATTVDQVYALLNEALGQIDAIATILDDYKTAAKAELNAYKSPELYRQNEVNELNRILAQAFASIDNCNDTLSVDIIVANAKTQIDALKTAAQYDAEELASAKRIAKAEIEAYVGLLELDRYSDENAALIQQLAMKARSDVDNATSKEEVNRIVEEFKQAIKDVKTNDGSTFDGEKYVEKGASKGCGGSVITSSIIISVIALCGMALLLKKKHLLMFK